jgi:lipopolysaccharide transport system ATP-binding protein
MSSNNNVISVNNLTKTYRIFNHPGDRLKQAMTFGMMSFHSRFTAIRDISFEITKGETIGIIGRNGSGKSTLLQLICGILKPTGGTVSAHGRISALLELGAGFNRELTGRENVYFQGALAGLTKSQIDDLFEDILAFAGIGEFINQPVWTYSSGMAIRLAFAASIHVEPDILIIDEALSVGDAEFQFKCFERMKSLAESGTTILLVSHDTTLVKSFCDRVIYLSQGKIKSVGPADRVIEEYFLDIRSEQKNQDQGKTVVSARNALSGSIKGIAFGSAQGSIVRAYFEPSRATALNIDGVTPICIHVGIEYDAELSDIYLSIFLQDHRLITIGGKVVPIKLDSTRQDRACVAVEAKFEAKLGRGTYFISFRLQKGKEGRDVFLLDKQSGALSIQVSPSSIDFPGMVDIGMTVSGTSGHVCET